MVPVTGLGEAAAGTATVGGLAAENVAVPLTVPLAAVTVALATGVPGAVSRPAVVIVPAVVVQVNVGCRAQAPRRIGRQPWPCTAPCCRRSNWPKAG